MIQNIFILDKNKQIIRALNLNGSGDTTFFNDNYILELETGAETFEFSTVSNLMTDTDLVPENYVLINYNNKHKLFQIMYTEEEHSEGEIIKTCYSEIKGLELLNDVLRETTLEGNIKAFLTVALQDTMWSVGTVDEELINNIQTIIIEKPKPVYTAIQENLGIYEAEIEFRVELKNNRVVGQYIDCYQKRGNQNSKYRFEYTRNLQRVYRKVDMTNFCSGLIGIGANNLNFKDIEWNLNGENPAEKPLGQDFLLDDYANSIYNNDGKYILGIYEDTSCLTAQDLLTATYKKLREVNEPVLTYEIDTALIEGEYDSLDIGDVVYVIDNDFNPPVQLEARIQKLEISFSDSSQNKCTLSNFKEKKSIIRPIETQEILNEVKNYMENIGLGKLSDSDKQNLKNYLLKMQVDKEDIKQIFEAIIAYDKTDVDKSDDEQEGTDEDYVYTKLKTANGGLWLGDDRLVSMREYKFFNPTQVVDSTTGEQTSGSNASKNYAAAKKLYDSLGMGDSTSISEYKTLTSSSNKYKIPHLVNYWSKMIGLDPYLVYAVIMAESTGNPYSEASAIGLMQCEKSVYYGSTQKISFLNGSSRTFTPSNNTLNASKGITITLGGVKVNQNISNQIMFGCHELYVAINKYCNKNIFGGLVAYNMGSGAMYWIVCKYVADKYGYSFVNRRSLSAQSSKVQTKFHEVIDSGKFDFKGYRQAYKNAYGGGTVDNVERYLRFYKSVDGQLPYTFDKNGKKYGYGVGGTTTKTTPVVNTVSYSKNAKDKRDIIVATAKAIVSQHVNQKIATYNQVPRTVNFKNPIRWSGTHYGIKNPIVYDCSSFVSCCYNEAGLTSVYNKGCQNGSLISSATSKGEYSMWKCDKEGLKKAIPGDILMDANFKITSSNLTASNMSQRNKTHHTMIYIGNNQVAHASQWAYHPNAIKISDISYYKNKGTAFFLRPWDLIQVDKTEGVEEGVVTDDGSDYSDETIEPSKDVIISKCVIGANAYDFFDDETSKLDTTVTVDTYTDKTKYPTSVPYVFIQFGLNDYESTGPQGIISLLKILSNKYKKTPIFIAKEIKMNYLYTDYLTVNEKIQALNDAILDYCNESMNCYQIDVSKNLTNDGMLSTTVSSNGLNYNSQDNYYTLYSNIKDKITSTNIINYSNASSSTTTKVSVVLAENTNYYYNTLKSLTFRLPSVVKDSYYSRLRFTTPKNGEPITFNQSEITYLDGTDCKNGVLIPKADTTYNVIFMTNKETDIDYKYYGAVSGIKNGGKYKDFSDFVGKTEIVKVAKTYLDNASKLEYANCTSTSTTTLKSTPADFTNPASNLSKWKNSSTGKYAIDCSTLVYLMFRGIKFEDSPYTKNNLTSIKASKNYSWTTNFPRSSANIAKHCVQNGWVLDGADLVNFSNIEPGDLIFHDADASDNGKYMNCSHVSMCYSNESGVMKIINVTSSGVVLQNITSYYPTKVLFVARIRKD